MEPQDPDRLIAFLESFRTVRFFEPAPVPQEILDDVLEVARSSGSARNLQPWEFVVVRDRRTLGRLAGLEGYAQHLSGAAVGIVLVMSGDPDKLEQETFDEGRLAERMSLAAASHGLGAAVGWFAGGGRNEAKRILGVPGGWSGPRSPWATPTATRPRQIGAAARQEAHGGAAPRGTLRAATSGRRARGVTRGVGGAVPAGRERKGR